MKDLIANPLVARALVVGIFGGIGLSLTSIYSRRGPMIYPVYAALLAALTLLLARYSQLSYSIRASAALVGFATATFISYLTVGVLANRQRDRLSLRGACLATRAAYRCSDTPGAGRSCWARER